MQEFVPRILPVNRVWNSNTPSDHTSKVDIKVFAWEDLGSIRISFANLNSENGGTPSPISNPNEVPPPIFFISTLPNKYIVYARIRLERPCRFQKVRLFLPCPVTSPGWRKYMFEFEYFFFSYTFSDASQGGVKRKKKKRWGCLVPESIRNDVGHRRSDRPSTRDGRRNGGGMSHENIGWRPRFSTIEIRARHHESPPWMLGTPHAALATFPTKQIWTVLSDNKLARLKGLSLRCKLNRWWRWMSSEFASQIFLNFGHFVLVRALHRAAFSACELRSRGRTGTNTSATNTSALDDLAGKNLKIYGITSVEFFLNPTSCTLYAAQSSNACICLNCDKGDVPS